MDSDIEMSPVKSDTHGYYVELHNEFVEAAGHMLRSATALLHTSGGLLLLRTSQGKQKIFRFQTSEISAVERKILRKTWSARAALSLVSGQIVYDENGEIAGKTEASYLSAPMMASSAVVFGVLLLVDNNPSRSFTAEDTSLINAFSKTFARLVYSSTSDPNNGRLMVQFSSNLVTILENLYLYKNNLENNFLLSEIIKVSKLINSTLDLQSLLESIMDSAKVVLKAEGASLMLIDEKTNELFFNTVSGEKERGLKEVRIPIGQGIAGIVAKTRKPEIVNDAQNDPRVFKQADETINFITYNMIASPLMVRNKVIGVIEVINSIGRKVFSEKDMELFNTFSEQAALAIHKRELIDSLQDINRELKKKVHELSSLHEVSKALISTIKEKDLFDSIVRIVADELGAEKVSIMLYNNEEQALQIASHFGLHINLLDPVNVSIGNSLSGIAFSENRVIYSNNLERSPFASFRNKERYHTGVCIIHPLGQGDKVYGVINISDKTVDLGFTEDDMRLVSTIAGQITKGIQNFRLLEEMLQKQAYEKELEITSSIQRSILPTRKLESSVLELGVLSVPAKIMGGDFYDYSSTAEEYTFAVADVSGKSLPAALFMAVSSSILRTISRETLSPSETLFRANDLIYQDSRSGMFVTLFLAKYDPETRELKYSSAGHNEQLIYRQDTQTFETLHARGRPLGVIDSELHGPYGEGSAFLTPGDLLILYTDGVVEAINERQEEFSLERFMSVIRETYLLPAEQITKRIFRAVTEFAGREPQFDDLTLLVIKIK